MSDFYVTLPSDSSKTEFPDNQPNSFKIRLPHPLRLEGTGWKVGVASVSLPEAPRKMNLNETFLFRIGWITLVDYQTEFYDDGQVMVKETDFETPPKTGTELFNAVRDRYLWHMNDQSSENQRFHKKGDPHQWTYSVMERAKDGVGRIDNSRTSTTIQINNSPRYVKLSIGLELAKAMRWVKMGTVNGQPQYVLGPNVRKEFNNNTLPKAVDVLQPMVDGDEMYYKIDDDGLHLSSFINWVFMDLDGSFERAFGSNLRPLYLYSNVMRSMVVGDRVVDLLMEIPYSLKERYFLPNAEQYMSVRGDTMDIIETKVTEHDGSLVNFALGVTTLTLHFKYE